MVLSINLFAFLHNKQSLSLQAEKPAIFNVTLDIYSSHKGTTEKQLAKGKKNYN